MTLIDDLATYDGTTVAILEVIADRHADDPGAPSLAVRLVVDPDGHVATGASWLLRRWLDEGMPLDPVDVRELGERLAEIPTHWARLHICQAMGSIQVPPDAAPLYHSFLTEAAESERPFLRAWGTDGLVRLAEQHPRYLPDARRVLEKAAGDPAASVRARARRILAESD